ncbi:lysylphosphatidylglycerol synthase transmembrane domain-containing protein [uncultured Alistipes sp.]|uniref:lysylphosphatidylglycerol synthase transmembrane domain-containing protein n=1 Tax=uncultured Alistipes sp. TaxID=538949 RepID=UPI002630BC2C|nr:lysylphosphatidylglycerol synthase transmembrane domain-containing protein [uncultured Alistipes sp.]
MTEPRTENNRGALSRIRLSRALYPIAIGLGVVGYMLWRDFDADVFSDVRFTWRPVFWLFMAVLFMFGRDLGYIVRIRVLSGNELSWLQAFRVIMLWEFTSAVTPSAVGGTSVAIVYVHKEGISVGRSSAIVMLTSFLDEVYFIVMFPLLMLLVGRTELFDVDASGVVARSLMNFALIGYFVKLAYVLLLSYGLFVNPRGIKSLLVRIFRLRFLRRWAQGAEKTGDDIVRSSLEIRRHGFRFWVGAGASTFLSWSSRYMVANALVLAFFSVGDQFLLFARQLVMWIMMLVMPTPGGSGFAEYVFSTYCRDLIEVPAALQLGAATLIALMWRGVTYYPYLAIGAVIFPRWIKRKFGKKATAEG